MVDGGKNNVITLNGVVSAASNLAIFTPPATTRSSATRA
jgi:hypothetical protein